MLIIHRRKKAKLRYVPLNPLDDIAATASLNRSKSLAPSGTTEPCL